MSLTKQHPKVSVILPFFNSAKTIDRAIESIENQTYKNFECILVDNNSSDGSAAIAKKRAGQDQRFKLIKEKKQGVVYASNTGSNVAKGEYVCRMDADDWAFPDRLKLQVEFLEQNPQYNVVSGLVDYIGHHSKTAGFKRYVAWVNSVRTYQQILLKRFIESPIVNPTAMWRKSVADKHGMYLNGNFPEDYEMWLRWLNEGVKICKIDSILIKWFDSDARLTRTDSRYSKNAFYEIKSQYLAQWLKTNNPHYPKVSVWGASRISRMRVKILEKHGIKIGHYIDISEKRKLDKEVLLHTNIPDAGKMFILIYVAQIKARDKIQAFLDKRGYREGENYLFVS